MALLVNELGQLARTYLLEPSAFEVALSRRMNVSQPGQYLALVGAKGSTNVSWVLAPDLSATRKGIGRRCRPDRRDVHVERRAVRKGIRRARARFRQMDFARLDLRRLRRHSFELASFRLDANWSVIPSGIDERRRSCKRFIPGPASSMRIVAGRWTSASEMTLRRRSGYSSRARRPPEDRRRPCRRARSCTPNNRCGPRSSSRHPSFERFCSG